MTWLKTRLFAVLSILTVILGVLRAVYGKGRADEREARSAQDNEDYRNERQQIDSEIRGIGGTDRERVDRLQSIANRRGSGKD